VGGYASGKYAIAICDRCALRYKLNQLKKEWTGFKVCQECYEPKHPQLETKRGVTDPQALFEPRPEKNMGMLVYLMPPGDTEFTSVGMQPARMDTFLTAVGMIGNVTVTTS
jgi:hypothetical protein